MDLETLLHKLEEAIELEDWNSVQEVADSIREKIDNPFNEYDEEETGLFTTKSDYLRIINLAKLRNITLDQQVKLGDHTTEIDYDTLVHLSNELTRYKQENNLIP